MFPDETREDGPRVEMPDLADALRSGQIRLEFQPEFDLRTGTVLAVEALARWDHPVQGPIRAEEFVSLAERSGRIAELGDWTLQAACAQQAAWRAELPGLELVVRVNVAAAQLADPAFVDRVLMVLQRTAVDPGSLGLEITERTEPDDPRALALGTRRLRAAGIHIALDDFGVGHNGLLRLRDLACDAVKIDKAFVTELKAGSRDSIFVQTIVQLAGRLQLDVVAEGIESDDAVTELLRLGCHRGQGFHLAEPAAAGKITKILTSGRG